jgi:exodeoxyribonuclease-3
MKIISWNVNGIRAVQKKGLFKAFLDTCDPDVICIQETKAQPEQVQAEFAEHYSQYYQYWNSATKKGYSGTAIFSKTEPMNVFPGFAHEVERKKLADTYGDTTQEGRVLTAEYAAFYIISVYTPNAKDNLGRLVARQAWDQEFVSHIQSLQAHKPVVVTGDLNVAHQPIDLSRPKQNKGKKGYTTEERSGFDKLLEAGLVDTYRTLFPNVHGAYTWWSHFANARMRNVGWRIDYILTSQGLFSKINKATIHNIVKGSDHCPVAIELKL